MLAPAAIFDVGQHCFVNCLLLQDKFSSPAGLVLPHSSLHFWYYSHPLVPLSWKEKNPVSCLQNNIKHCEDIESVKCVGTFRNTVKLWRFCPSAPLLVPSLRYPKNTQDVPEQNKSITLLNNSNNSFYMLSNVF